MKRILFTVPMIFGFVAISSIPAQARVSSVPAQNRPAASDVSERSRTFINSDGLECVEKSRMDRNGRRSYDLSCKEPKGSRGLGRGRGNAPDDRRSRVCVDANRDGMCDQGWEANGRYPSKLPDMIGAMQYTQGRRTKEITNWLGTGQYGMRYIDANRDRRPEQMIWVDSAGRILQEWIDTNRDGRADSVRVVR